MARAGLMKQMLKFLGAPGGGPLVPQRVRAKRNRDNKRLPEDEREHAGLVPAMLVSTAVAAIYIIVQA